MIDTYAWTHQPLETILLVKESYLRLDKLHCELLAAGDTGYLRLHEDCLTPEGYSEFARGVGAAINVKKGIELFELDYQSVRFSLAREVSEKLRSASRRGKVALQLDIHYVIDSDCNTFGDILCHRYRIFVKP